MINAEYWKKKLVELREAGDKFAVKNGIPCGCSETKCKECEFSHGSNYAPDNCGEIVIDWLLEEHKEPEIDWDNDIDWLRVPPNTEVLGTNNEENRAWHRSYFAIYVPRSTAPYRIFGDGARLENATYLAAWNYCKLAKHEDIEKYRKRG